MLIKLDNWEKDILYSAIVYPILNTPSLPVSLSSFTINCESTFIQWIEEFIRLYGDQGSLLLDSNGKRSYIKVNNDNFDDVSDNVAKSVWDFGGSLD